MKLSQLRDTRQLKACLKAGEMIEIHERNRVLAWIVPVPKAENPVHAKIERRQKPRA